MYIYHPAETKTLVTSNLAKLDLIIIHRHLSRLSRSP